MNPLLSVLLWTTYAISLYFAVFWLLVFVDNKSTLKRHAPKLNLYPDVSVIVPAFNEEDTVFPTLSSIVNLNYPKEHLFIIAVDDGSKDSTLSKMNDFKASHPKTNLLVLTKSNGGKASALNFGLDHTLTPFFACLDADSTVDPDTLLKMLHTFENSPQETVIVTPAMKVHDPKTIWQKLQRVEYFLSMYMARLMSQLDCLYVAPGPFSVYRTKVIKNLGGFEVGNITEDMEIAYRVQSHNYKIDHCPGAWVYTVSPTDFKALCSQRNRWFKGGLINSLKYKHLLLNRGYGDFGLAQMSINLLLFFLSASAILFFGYYLVYPILKSIYHLYLINFDFWPLLSHIKLTFYVINIDIEKVFVANSLLAISLFVFYAAHKAADEKLTASRSIIIPYFFVYYLLLSFIAVQVFFEYMLGKTQRW